MRKQALARVDNAYAKKSEAKFNRDSSTLRQQISSTSSDYSVSPHQPKPMVSVARVPEPTLPRLRSKVVPENLDLSSEEDEKK